MSRAFLTVLALAGLMACDTPVEDSDHDMQETDGSETEAAAFCFEPHTAPEMVYAPDDPRMGDAEYAWSADALRTGSECVACHRTPDGAKSPAEYAWDIGCMPVWTDSATDGVLETIAEMLVDPGEGRFYLDMETRQRLSNLIQSELARRADRRAE